MQIVTTIELANLDRMTDYMQFQIKEKSDKNGQLLIPFSAKHYAVHDKIL